MENDKINQLSSFVSNKLHEILSTQENKRKAILAQLRDGVGKELGENPQTSNIALDGMPKDFRGWPRGVPSREEQACYTALTLFAMHQQSFDVKSEPMHKSSDRAKNIYYSLGKAMSIYGKEIGDSERAYEKLSALSLPCDTKEIVEYLNVIVKLLHSKGIPLDYITLAKDIYFLQNSEKATSVLFAWCEDFWCESSAKYSKIFFV